MVRDASIPCIQNGLIGVNPRIVDALRWFADVSEQCTDISMKDGDSKDAYYACFSSNSKILPIELKEDMDAVRYSYSNLHLVLYGVADSQRL